MAKRIVIDTSVVISALISKRGASREVLRQCLLGNYKPSISNTLFQECEAVSARAEVRRNCPLNTKEIETLLNSYYGVCQWVSIHYLWRPNLSDENDNFLIELAVAGNCDVIVTNNVKDLVDTELNFNNLKILRPQQLLRDE